MVAGGGTAGVSQLIDIMHLFLVYFEKHHRKYHHINRRIWHRTATPIESRYLIPADAPLFFTLLLRARAIGFTTHSFDVSWRADHYGCINAINIFGLPTLQS